MSKSVLLLNSGLVAFHNVLFWIRLPYIPFRLHSTFHRELDSENDCSSYNNSTSLRGTESMTRAQCCMNVLVSCYAPKLSFASYPRDNGNGQY